MAKISTASHAHIRRHWDMLCNQIGRRYSGTDGEQRAADYIENQFRILGLSDIHQHQFEFPNWTYSSCAVQVGRGKRSRKVTTARPACFSRSTTAKGVRGKLVYLQSGGELDFKQNLRGKIGLLIGSLSLGNDEVKRRLLRSKLAGLLTVDDRIPYGWTITAGWAPQWVDGFDIPSASIAYLDAVHLVRLIQNEPLDVHITIKAKTFAATSQNVVGQITGSTRPNQVIVVSGHHDCVWGNVGADDNASGVVFTLELARLFAYRRPRRTIRFISYGVEEKLSIGAYLYMRSLSQKQRKQCLLAINADAIATCAGTDVLNVTGTAGLEKLVRNCWRRHGHEANICRTVTPYSDHFPLNICGTPSIWLSRPSIMTDGYWTLHSVHDNLDNVSSSVISKTINTTAKFLDQVVTAPRLPFRPTIDPQVMAQVRAVAKQAYRHPWSPDKFRYPRGHSR